MTGVPITFFMGKAALAKATTVFDAEIPGLGIRVTTKGKASYVLKYQYLPDGQTKKKAKWVKMASCSTMTLDQARQLAYRMKLLAEANQDPTKLLKSTLVEEGIQVEPAISFGKFAKIYIEDHAKEFKDSWKKDQQRIDDFFLPVWKDRSIASITRADVTKMHKTISKKDKDGKRNGKVAANRAIETLSKMFNLAVFWGHLPDNHANPCKGIQKHKEIERGRFLSKAEMKKVGEVLRNYPDCPAVDAIKFDLYTGLRTGELLKLRWDWIDFDECLLMIPASVTKTDDPLFLPLNDASMRLLRKIKAKQGPNGSVFCFPGRLSGTHVSRIDKHWRAICKLAQIDNAKPHDIRRTVGSWVIHATGNISVVGKILNQTQETTTNIYSRFGLEEVRAALDALGAKMSSYLEFEAVQYQ